MSPAAAYFAAERAESLVFMAIGVAALAASFLFWFGLKTRFWRGMAWPLALIAAIQITVGSTIWLRSPLDAERVQQIVQQEPARVKGEEIPRMQAVMRNFELYRWVETILLALGALLAWRAKAGSGARGVGLGLSLQAGAMLTLDHFAQQRGEVYLRWLQSVAV